MKKWKLDSWKNYPVKHIPKYDDMDELNLVLNKIKRFPPLVFAGESRSLIKQLSDVCDGKAFLLQGGDCAESFAEFHPDNIKDTFKVILQMALVMSSSASLPVVKVGRIAGHLDNKKYKKLISNLKNLPQLIKETLKEEEKIQLIAKDIYNSKGSMFLGRGSSYPIAMEGALKLKELSYLHAEGYPAGEMKHGPLALIEDGLPVVVIAPKDKYFEKTLSNMQEVIARGGKVLLLTNSDGKVISENIRFQIDLPSSDLSLTPFIFTIPLQLLSYHVALFKKCDIDKPRNLAKSVTVE